MALELTITVIVVEVAVMSLLPLVASVISGLQAALIDALLLAAFVLPLVLLRAAAWRRADQTVVRAGRPPRLATLATAAAIVLGVCGSIVLSLLIAAESERAAEARFAARCDRIATATQKHFDVIASGLRWARGVFAASRTVERDEFRAYAKSRELESEFPGALGIGFIEPVSRRGLDAFEAAARADGAPDFAVATGGDADDLFVVKFMEPSSIAPALVGRDIGANPELCRAAERATLTGETVLGGGDADPRDPGDLILMSPVYRQGTDPLTPEARRAALIGWVGAPIAPASVFAGLDAMLDGGVAVVATEIDQSGRETQLFRSDDELRDSAGGDVRAYRRSSSVTIGDRIWTLGFRSTPTFARSIDTRTSHAALGTGVLVTILFAAFSWSTITARSRAAQLAAEMTADLARAKDRAETALREIDALRHAIDRTAIVSVTDPSGVITEVNDTFCSISGWSREELIGKTHRIVNSGHHGKEFWAEAWRTIRNGGVFSSEVCNRRKDGSLYWVAAVIVPFRSTSGEITKYVSIRHDITTRKAAEERIAASERQFRALADSTPALIWVVGPDAKCTWVNRGWREFTGRTMEEESGDGWIEGVHPDDRTRCFDTFIDAFRRRAVFEFEYRLRRSDGEQRWVLDRGAPHVGANGEFLGYVGLAIDVTEMRELREAALAANTAKSEFLANMSHEIRTPLTAILGYAEILRDDGDLLIAPERRVATIDTIRSAGGHLLTVINDILDLSKIESGKMTVEKIETDLPRLIGQTAALIRPRAAEKGVALDCVGETLLPRFVLTDPTRLRQILMNLIGNAAKFTDSGAVRLRVGVDGATAGERLVVDVEDTGPGMSEEEAARLFGVFAQADSSVTRRFGGAGLGLAISRRLARLLGGDVELVRTAPGAGSTFRFAMPLKVVGGAERVELRSGERAVEPALQEEGAPALSGRILVAEDGRDNQKLIQFILTRFGAEVELAENGRVALEMIAAAESAGRPYDLLLTDMQMPEMDGYSLARTLRGLGRTLPIVALTAHAMAEDRDKCLAAGCDDYTTKPVDRKHLIETCAKWLAQRLPVGPGCVDA